MSHDQPGRDLGNAHDAADAHTDHAHGDRTDRHPDTIAVSAGRPTAIGEPLNHPIVLASNIRGEEGVYARTHGVATWAGLEEAVGALEGGQATAFATGMAAASAALFALAPRILVLPTFSYLGVRALVNDLVEQSRLQVRFVDITDTAAVVEAADGADVVWVETPTNPTLDVADVRAIAEGAHGVGARVVVDSTFATPICSRPLVDGADVVMHSGTKYLGGHSDLMFGAVVCSEAVPSIRSSQLRRHHLQIVERMVVSCRRQERCSPKPAPRSYSVP